MTDKFKVVVASIITCNGEILIGKKRDDNTPSSGEWHFPGGLLDKGEKAEEAVKRELREETGLEVQVHRVIDVNSFPFVESEDKDNLMILYHCESDSKDAVAGDDLVDVKWVKPENLRDELWSVEAERLEKRDNQSKFLEKLKQIPVI